MYRKEYTERKHVIDFSFLWLCFCTGCVFCGVGRSGFRLLQPSGPHHFLMIFRNNSVEQFRLPTD